MRVRILAAVVLLLAGSSAVSILVLRSVLLDRLEEEITVDLSQEVEEFELLLGGIDPRTARSFDDLASLFDVYFSREVPDEGESILAFVERRLYRSEIDDAAVTPDRVDDAVRFWLSLDERAAGERETGAGRVRYHALPLERGGQRGLFVVANFPAFERGEITGAVRTQAVTQAVMIVVASLIGLGLAGRVLRPLRSLADTARTISETDLTRRIPMHGRDEASRISGAFNDMLSRLEQAFVAQRTFLDEASHELRVPLTVIRGHVEILELIDDPDERGETITVIINEIERMSRIVDDLLLLARAERPGFLSLEHVDLGELTADVHRKAAVLAARDWQLESRADCTIVGDGQRLTQAMMQLAQNACQHTADGVTIRIGSRLDGDRAVLWVHDDGPGIPPADAAAIFERFVKGRSSDGSGLGLSIVSAIAEAHGGRARVAPGVGNGARFEIRLPAPAAGTGSGDGRGTPGQPPAQS